MTSRLRSAPPRKLTMAEQVQCQIDALYELMPIALNDRRSHLQHDDLVDQLTGVGRTLCRLGRG